MKARKKNYLGIKMVVTAFLTIFLSLIMSTPTFAGGYPDAGDGEQTTGSSATTDVSIKIDESQLSFTAPAFINFAMKADGSFIYPTDGQAKFINNSKFDLKVASYNVESDVVAKGCSSTGFESATDSNAYKISISPLNSSNLYDFAVNQVINDNNWTIPCSSGNNTLKLTFSNGMMKNITSNTWTSGHPLQKVEWLVSAK